VADRGGGSAARIDGRHRPPPRVRRARHIHAVRRAFRDGESSRTRRHPAGRPRDQRSHPARRRTSNARADHPDGRPGPRHDAARRRPSGVAVARHRALAPAGLTDATGQFRSDIGALDAPNSWWFTGRSTHGSCKIRCITGGRRSPRRAPTKVRPGSRAITATSAPCAEGGGYRFVMDASDDVRREIELAADHATQRAMRTALAPDA